MILLKADLHAVPLLTDVHIPIIEKSEVRMQISLMKLLFNFENFLTHGHNIAM